MLLSAKRRKKQESNAKHISWSEDRGSGLIERRVLMSLIDNNIIRYSRAGEDGWDIRSRHI